jgi:F0F1-type ATP synthase membrane subunit c/vacuolar-type H+-ATPase subunit K
VEEQVGSVSDDVEGAFKFGGCFIYFLFLKTLSLFALNCSLLKYFKSENKM